MKVRNILITTLTLILMMGAIAAVGSAHEAVDVNVTVNYLSDGSSRSATLVGLDVAENDDDDDAVLYLPAEILFSFSDSPFVLRDDRVYFPVGNSVRSVDALIEEDVVFVPALDTLRSLGLNRALSGRNLYITVW